ncbi:MAG: hypothetical protein OXD01_02475 [Gammaproteobacteria bacterium]|nr:hypothetical protein [Gammaproteobacteria bacterium]
MNNDKKLEKAAKSLLAMKGASRKRPKKPRKADLERRFKPVVDRRGKPSMVEVD